MKPKPKFLPSFIALSSLFYNDQQTMFLAKRSKYGLDWPIVEEADMFNNEGQEHLQKQMQKEAAVSMLCQQSLLL